MQENRLLSNFRANMVPVGHMIWEFGTRGIARMTELAGLDFVLLDTEHGAFSPSQIADLIAWYRATSVTPMVRVPQRAFHMISRTLDAGAQGIMMPNVMNAAMARQVVQAAKFAPVGNRGLGLGGSATAYVSGDVKEQMHALNTQTAIICQIESREALEELDAIASVPGVDVMWVGQADLSQSLGIPGEFDNSEFLDALREVVDCCERHGLGAGIQPNSPEQCKDWIDLGFNIVSYSVDTALFTDALTEARTVISNLTQ